MRQTRWVLRVTFLSDWHVGSGHGRPGEVDRLLARDHEGLPYLPAKTVVGSWRDACERLAWGLDGGQHGAWAALVEQLFGSQPSQNRGPDREAPRPARLCCLPARLPAAVRLMLFGSPAQTGEQPDHRALLRQALTLVKPGVAIDRASGSAGHDFLRFEEMGRLGTVLEAECEIATDDSVALDFLVAATGLMDRLGGKRRRGTGRCRVEVIGRQAAVAAGRLAVAAAPRLSQTAYLHGELSLARSSEHGWRVVPLRVRLETPLTVAARVVGNVIECLDYVPGTQFLPHVTRVIEALGGEPRAWIGRGDLRLLDATIEIDGRRGLPLPMALWQRKDGKPFANRGDVVNALAGEEIRGGAAKQMRRGYLGDAPAGALPRWQTVETVLRTHNSIEDQLQRPTEATGGLYSQMAIAAGTVLRTELRLRQDLADRLPAGWEQRLTGRLRLGTSKKDDYGLVTLELAGEPDPTAPSAAGETLTVWLLSDLLLRDESLRPDPSAERLRLTLEEELNVALEIEQVFARTRRLDSWHVGWGLPRPSLVGLAAGSCLRLKVTGNLTPEALADLSTRGLGERRAEGYGDLFFNHPLLAGGLAECEAADTTTVASVPTTPPPLPPDLAELVHAIELAAWRKAIERAALRWAAQPQNRTRLGWSKSLPPASQLGALRSAMAHLTNDDTASVSAWLEGVEARANRRDKWPGGLDAVKKLIDAQERALIWTLLEAEQPVIVPDHAETLRTALWAEAVRALLDAAVRAQQREREQAAGPAPKETVHGT